MVGGAVRNLGTGEEFSQVLIKSQHFESSLFLLQAVVCLLGELCLHILVILPSSPTLGPSHHRNQVGEPKKPQTDVGR